MCLSAEDKITPDRGEPSEEDLQGLVEDRTFNLALGTATAICFSVHL